MASLNSAINANVLGMKSISTKMGANAQNIAAAGVIGAKERDVFLSALNNDTLGGGFTPGGVSYNTTMNIAKVGSSTPSSTGTHLSIAGQGMFIVNQNASNTAPGQYIFTRVGTFEPDKDGNFKNHEGLFLKGFPTDKLGNPLATDVSTFTQMQTISTAELTGIPQATTNISLPLNLPGGSALNSTSQTPFTVYDSLGTPHQVTLTWTKIAETNGISQTWRVTAACADGTVGGNFSGLGMDVVFGATGLPTGFYVATSPASTTTPIAAPSLTFSWNHAAANSTIAVNLGTLNQGNGVTCYNSPYTPSKFSIDGRPVGRLISVNINETGLVNATYDNGTTEFFAKVPIATFTNVNGLQPIYGGYSQTQQSGPYNLTFPNLGGAGPLRPGTTEDSTIDPAEIFTKMIVDQKLYTANLKGITTVEKMLDALERSIGI